MRFAIVEETCDGAVLATHRVADTNVDGRMTKHGSDMREKGAMVLPAADYASDAATGFATNTHPPRHRLGVHDAGGQTLVVLTTVGRRHE